MGPGRQLLLITTGRKSREPRSVGLTYLTDAERFIVIASNAGEDANPLWWLNLLAEPSATVVCNGESFPIAAHEVEEPERSAVFSRFVAATDASYLEYQKRTARRLPVVALTKTVL